MPVHPLLTGRWSPTSFDTATDITAEQAESLLEAARWAPSAGNSQPWAFIVTHRGEPDHARLVAHLAGSSASWAPTAALLIANLSHRYVAETDWDYSEFSLYDLGQAVAHMSFQAASLGLHVRQFRAFDRDGIAAEFGVPPHWQVSTMSAIGSVPAGTTALTDRRAAPPARSRRPTAQLRWPAAADATR
jgi:nitroreductase